MIRMQMSSKCSLRSPVISGYGHHGNHGKTKMGCSSLILIPDRTQLLDVWSPLSQSKSSSLILVQEVDLLKSRGVR